MVLPFDPRELFTTRDDLRDFAKLSIYSAYEPGASANSIINDMKELGLSYRRTDMLADIRFVKGLEVYESSFQRMDSAGIVPKAWMQEVPYSLTNQAQYRYRITVFDEETGQLETLDRAHATNNWYTKDEAEEFMGGFMAGPLAEYGKRLLGVDLYEVWTKEAKLVSR